MPDVGESERGQDTSKSLSEVVDALESTLNQTDAPAVALGDVTGVSNYSRQTVNDRLDDAKATAPEAIGGRSVNSAKIGGSKGYWIEYVDTQPDNGVHIPEPKSETDGGPFTRLEAAMFWYGGVAIVGGALAVLAGLGLWAEQFALYPRLAGDIHITALVAYGGVVVVASGVVSLLGVFFAAYLKRARRRVGTHWVLFKGWLIPRMLSLQQKFANHRPGNGSRRAAE